MLKKQVFSIALLLFMLLAAIAAPTYAAEKLKIGIAPQQDAVKTLKMFQPLADYLSSKVGLPMEIATSPDWDTYMTRVKQKEFDLIYPNQMAIMLNYTAGYETFAIPKQEGLTKFRGILVVRKDGSIKSINDLRGKTAVFADPTAVSSYLLPKAKLLDYGIDVDKDLTVKFAGKHDSAILAVYNRAADVAGVKEPALAMVKDKIDINQLQVLAASDWVPQQPFAAKKQLDPKLVEKIKAALLALDRNGEPGATILKTLNFDGFVAATESDMDPLRVLAKKLGLKEE